MSEFWEPCPICGGTGKLEDDSGDDVLSMTVCSYCHGTGKVPGPEQTKDESEDGHDR